MIKALLTVLAVLVSTAAFAGDVPGMTEDALLARMASGDKTLVVLDVRTPKEFADGHVPGAINISHDQLEGRMAELDADRDRDVVVYCRSGHRAGLALGMLEKAGFKRLYHLEGDYIGWTEAKRPVETAPAPAAVEPAGTH
jgi:rhodanese-related sulfurtransferase